MRVLFVASECAPFVKTGGLADVVGALPKALAAHGIEVRVVMPAYPALNTLVKKAKTATDLGTVQGGPARLVAAKAQGLDLLLLDAPHLYDRPGNIYLGPDGKDWPDNYLRYGALSSVAASLAAEGLDGWTPDLVHAHDWQAGLVAAYLKLRHRGGPKTVITIHNIAFQGLFPPTILDDVGLPSAAFTIDGFEYFGQVSCLKAGLVYSDRITTVSPTYARELMTDTFGMGLEGLLALRRDDLSGILNGIDLDIWNPEADGDIAAPYSARAMGGKAKNKAALEKRFGLARKPNAPLFCVISRLTEQKGLDLLLQTVPRIVQHGARLVLLGSGQADLEKGFTAAAKIYPRDIGVVLGYDEPLSHLMQAGADAILIPSRFEPCGLTQLYGLRYGTLPVVARTGGLVDTVIDANAAALAAGCATGFHMSETSVAGLSDAMGRVCDAYSDKKRWREMMRCAMRHPVGWDRSAGQYADLYAGLVNGGGARGG